MVVQAALRTASVSTVYLDSLFMDYPFLWSTGHKQAKRMSVEAHFLHYLP